MQRLTFLTRALALASVLVLVPSCGGRDADVEFLPAAPASLEQAQAKDPRPVYPADGATSEAAHENWANDHHDWGDRRDVVAYRWCQLWNKFASVSADCGPKPAGVE
jgi:hypothetical protein